MEVKYIDLPAQYNELEQEIESGVKRVLKSGWYVMGPELERFEAGIAKYCGSKYALGVANGTDALIMGLRLDCVTKEEDEIITVPNSFIASAGAIAAVGAKPVFVDVGLDYNIDPESIEEAITGNTRAIMPVHLTGRPADMRKIVEIAEGYGLGIIEDAAQSIGATIDGVHVGNFGHVGAFSLHPLKTLNACGDAGFLITNSEGIYNDLKKMRNHGLMNRDESEFYGMNSRLDEMQAVILNTKLKYVDQWTDRRREIAHVYNKNLADVIEVPGNDIIREKSVFHTFVAQCDKRDELQAYLLGKGIDSKVHYPLPLHLHKASKDLGYKKGDFPAAESQAERILSLPVHQYLKDEQVEYVVDTIKKFYK